MNQNLHTPSKGIPRNVKRALLIMLILVVSVVVSDMAVNKAAQASSSSGASTEALPEFNLAASNNNAGSVSVGDVSALNSEALTEAFAAYESDLLNHFGVAWVSPCEVDSSLTQELFGVSPHQFEALTQTSQLLWNQQTNKGAMGLLGWIIEPQSPLTPSLTTHSAYLAKQGWTPVASNSETTLSLVKERNAQQGLAPQSRYSWLLVELISVGEKHLVLYSFQ